MHHLYFTCILFVLSVGYLCNVEAFPAEAVPWGVRGTRKPKIINGTLAQVGQFPWMASIKRNGAHVCGGSIIGRRWILSAAHCFIETLANLVWTVTLGEYNTVVDEAFSVTYAVRNVIMHEKYMLNLTRRMVINDIALLELSEDIQWTRHIQPIRFPAEDIQKSSDAITAGWGPAANPRTNPDENKLRFVKIDIFNNTQCNEIYKRHAAVNRLEKLEMCAGKLDLIKDTSSGDSGGPLFVTVEGKPVLVGITSHGVTTGIGQRPGYYMRVFEYMDWIMSKMHRITNYYPPLPSNNL